VILAAGGLVNALAGPSANLLSLTGSERYVSRVMLAVTGLNIMLNLMFIPRWGVEGAALATAISMVAWNVVMFVTVRRRLGLEPNGIFRRSGVTR
jgi:O-antigen/teichoic acid export membrane protein